ncbi:hypothetical protein K3495_g5580 [Podosphaera aphanis]|nr:hypothetical protein K3495_g5580 [Podosphaera aphanis]
MSANDILLGLLAIIFPPIAVWVKRGVCSADSLINLLLCALGGIPGLLHAWYIITKYPEDEERSPNDPETGPIIVVVQTPYGPRGVARPSNLNQNISYGTTTQKQTHSTSTSSTSPTYHVQTSSQDGTRASVPPTYAEATNGGYKFQN